MRRPVADRWRCTIAIHPLPLPCLWERVHSRLDLRPFYERQHHQAGSRNEISRGLFTSPLPFPSSSSRLLPRVQRRTVHREGTELWDVLFCRRGECNSTLECARCDAILDSDVTVLGPAHWPLTPPSQLDARPIFYTPLEIDAHHCNIYVTPA